MSIGRWTRIRLSEIAEIRLGRQRSPKRSAGPNMRPYVRAANVTWDGISLHDVKKMDFTPAEFETYALRPGDLLLSEASGSPSEVGKPAIWAGQVPDCCFQNTLIRVRLHDSSLAPFLHLHFYKDALTGRFADASRGVGIHHLGARTLSEWPIHLPPPAEQRRIVETVRRYFQRIDEVVGALERVRRNLRRYRASVLQAAAAGRLAPTEADLARAEGRGYEPASVLLDRILAERRRRWEEAELAKTAAKGKAPKDGWRAKYREPAAPDTAGLPALPEGWRWATIDQVLSEPLVNGRSVRSVTRGFPVLRLTSLRENGRIDLDERKTGDWSASEARPFLVRHGDFFVSRGNGSLRLVGRGGLVESRPDPVAFPDTLIRMRFGHGIEPRFLAAIWNSRTVRGQVERKARTTAGIFKVNQHDLETCVFPLPPFAEQVRIAQEIDRFGSWSEVSMRAMNRCMLRVDTLRQAILDRAFEGEIVGHAVGAAGDAVR